MKTTGEQCMSDKDSTLAQFDQAGAKRLEKIYLTPDVVQQREQIFQLLQVKPGMQALDIGCGPGLTSLALSQSVGDKGRVEAIDIAPPMLQLAARRCEYARQVAFHQADGALLSGGRPGRRICGKGILTCGAAARGRELLHQARCPPRRRCRRSR
jgi:ubiquinone/menaquinone biosynthesis C-methylase UbiE